jgi:hypothetical protein
MPSFNSHWIENLPWLLTGRVGGQITIAEKTPACNLYLKLLERAGMQLERFGDSTGKITGLKR